MSQHQAIDWLNKFCALRADPCQCGSGQHYKANARQKAVGKISGKSWAKITFPQVVTDKKTGATSVRNKVPEAHHVLCTATVRDHLLNDPAIQPVVGTCTWCINAAVNMVPLPLWGHTVKYYHS